MIEEYTEQPIIEEYIPEPYKVYVQTDSDGRITATNSSAFLTDITNWTQIDEGLGDRYHHAQGNYIGNGLIDEQGCYNYKLVDGEVVERTAEEKQVEIDARPAPPPMENEILRDYVLDLDYRLIMMELGI